MRSYHQLCPLAYCLDVLGERWTLLIVRELLFGPRRFKDIMKGLPGIGTNLLAGRLKKLEKAGVIQKRSLPPPAGSSVYTLTTRGEDLRPVTAALAEWGMSLLRHAEEDDFLGVVPTMSAMTLMFDRDSMDGKIVCELRVSDEVFHASVRGGEISVTSGSASSPDLVLTTETKTVLFLLGKPDDAVKTAEAGKFTVDKGDPSALRRFFGKFHTLEQMSEPPA